MNNLSEIRAKALELAILMGDKDKVIENAKIFERFINGETSIPRKTAPYKSPLRDPYPPPPVLVNPNKGLSEVSVYYSD